MIRNSLCAVLYLSKKGFARDIVRLGRSAQNIPLDYSNRAANNMTLTSGRSYVTTSWVRLVSRDTYNTRSSTIVYDASLLRPASVIVRSFGIMDTITGYATKKAEGSRG